MLDNSSENRKIMLFEIERDIKKCVGLAVRNKLTRKDLNDIIERFKSYNKTVGWTPTSRNTLHKLNGLKYYVIK